MRIATRSASLALCLITCSVAAQTDDGPYPVEREQILRPGMPYLPYRPEPGNLCTIGLLVTDGAHVYATTSGHCYANSATHNPPGGFEDWGAGIDRDRDNVFSPQQCPSILTSRWVCSTGKRWGRFVYALNNAFPDPADGGVAGQPGRNGTHNPAVPVGDFGLIRLHPGVPYDPAMCHFGGPIGLYTNAGQETVVIRLYHSGNAFGYNEVLDRRILPAWTTVAVMGQTPSPWYSPYTFTGVPAPDFGASGGPVMTADGLALGVLGGIHYLDRLDTNLKRAGARLNKTFSVLTAPLNTNATPFGIDQTCMPAPAQP